jgi:hypothetical protein
MYLSIVGSTDRQRERVLKSENKLKCTKIGDRGRAWQVAGARRTEK